MDERNIKTDCVFRTSDLRRTIGKRIVHARNCCMYIKKKIKFIFGVLRRVYVAPEHGSISSSCISKKVTYPSPRVQNRRRTRIVQISRDVCVSFFLENPILKVTTYFFISFSSNEHTKCYQKQLTEITFFFYNTEK